MSATPESLKHGEKRNRTDFETHSISLFEAHRPNPAVKAAAAAAVAAARKAAASDKEQELEYYAIAIAAASAAVGKAAAEKASAARSATPPVLAMPSLATPMPPFGMAPLTMPPSMPPLNSAPASSAGLPNEAPLPTTPTPAYPGAPAVGYNATGRPMYLASAPFANPQLPEMPSTEASPVKKVRTDWVESDLEAFLSAPEGSQNELLSFEAIQSYKPNNIDLGPVVDTFYDVSNPTTATATSNRPALTDSDRETLSLFRAMELRSKNIANDVSNKLRESAIRLTKVLSASGQLMGWKLVETFLNTAAATADSAATTGSAATANSAATAASTAAAAGSMATIDPTSSEIDQLTKQSHQILRHAMTRAEWVLDIEKRASSTHKKTIDRIIDVLLKDVKWMTESASFLKKAEQQVSILINQNPAAFAQYRETQSKVPWPHTDHLRRVVERAGFVFRPMMVKRDRCVCDTCGVEVSGWRPWHNPWLFHDWSKNHPFRPAGLLTRSSSGLTETMLPTGADALAAAATAPPHQ